MVRMVAVVLILGGISIFARGQIAATGAPVPNLVSFTGTLKDSGGRPIQSITGVTFSLYAQEQGGAPLWLETQNVQSDSKGNYTVQLGATKPEGLPQELFTSGAARWLGIRISGGEEQPRVLLLSVPYALKAADAQTLGGLPASAFALAAPAVATDVTLGSIANSSSVSPAVSSDVTTTGGTAGKIPMFTTATNVQNSILTQTSSTAINVGGKLNLPATGTAIKTAGKSSQPEALVASSFNSSSNAAVNQTFQWQAEPAANGTANPSGTLNLLYGPGATAPSETGLKLSSKGLFTFATGQTFPGAGTITGVMTASGSGLAGGGTSGTLNLSIPAASVTNIMLNHPSLTVKPGTALTGGGAIALGGATTLNLDTTKVPLLASANTFTANQTINGGLTATTSTTANGIGVYGVASTLNGIGVFGQSVSESNTGLTTAGMGAGVWGDGGTGSSGRIGVVGTVDDDIAGLFINNSPSQQYTMLVQSLNSAANPFIAYGTGGSCEIEANGDLSCTGTVSAVVPIDGGKRKAAMSAIVSPVNWTEDAGESQLSKGAAVVEMDSTFTQTVNTEMNYQVFLTPYGDCKGLYVTNRKASSFEVHELGGGTSTLSFGYRIMAVRKKYEAIRFADHTKDPVPFKPVVGAKPGSATKLQPPIRRLPSPSAQTR